MKDISDIWGRDTDLHTKHRSQILFLPLEERVLRFSFVTARLQKLQEEQHASLQSFDKSICPLMHLIENPAT